MKLLRHIFLQWKLDFRNKAVLLPFYVIPIVFFLVMGFVFQSVLPDFENTLTFSMIIFAVVMASSLGLPAPLSEIYGTDIIKSYKMGNIPASTPLFVGILSGGIHILMVSIIIFLLCPVLFHTSMPENLGQFLLSYFLFLMASLGIGAFIGTHFKSTSGLAVAGQVIFLPSIMLSGIMFPSSMLPKALQVVSSVFPATLGASLMSSTSSGFLNYFILFVIFIIAIVLSILKIRRAS